MKLKQDGCQSECTKLYINMKLLAVNNLFIMMHCGTLSLQILFQHGLNENGFVQLGQLSNWGS